MRPLSVVEIEQLVELLDIYRGQPLQTAVVGAHDLVLGFWASRRVLWIWLDLNATMPFLVPLVDLPLTPKAKPSPLQLFLRAHFVGRTLVAIERLQESGRVVRFVFESQDKYELTLEFRMIPRAMNLIARAQDKQVSFMPVKILAEHQDATFGPPRILREIVDEWKGARLTPKTEKKSPRTTLEKRLVSLKKSLAKVEAEVEVKAHSPWRRLGEWLLENQSMDVPAEFIPLLDQRRKLAWNIEQCFAKAKEAERKLVGTRARVNELKSSILDLETRFQEGNWLSTEAKPKASKTPLPPARTLHLQGFQITAGKSARDNIDLLRRAHAWDIWLHVKDQPSAHAILFRTKGAKISDEVLRKSAQWLIRMSLGSKFKSHIGEKYEILSAECRFVSPIKGDRLGRVTYRNEKVFMVKFEGS